jgi:NAD(P)-dependent dehydrogenase (short-subunit alcohol dehydrogenase family)
VSKKYCLITGAAGFLGMHYSQLLLQNGYNVIGVDININPLKKIKNKSFTCYYCDISNEQEVNIMFLNFKKKNYFINLLINNAAIDSVPIKKSKKISRLSDIYDWDKELNVGLKGSYLMIKYFGEEMSKKKDGNIINIGSDLSVIAPNQDIYKKAYKNFIKPVTYSVIKHGLYGMTKYFSSLYAKDKVRVNMLSPGPVFRNHKKDFINEIKTQIPMGRMADKSDLNSSLLFLADEKNIYLTGQNIIVDGGKTVI